MEGHEYYTRLSVCPICKRKGKQEIIEGILCYIHRKKYEKCCKWGKVINLGELLNQRKNNYSFNINIKPRNNNLGM
jgi:hypothetical protein